MVTANICLRFAGNCDEAFNYYRSVFGGEFSALIRYGDIPAVPGLPELSVTDKNMIENIMLPLGGGSFLMGGDGIEAYGNIPVAGSNFSVYINCSNSDEGNKIFEGLSNGGMVMMPFDRAHWGDWFGMCTDRFGISWLVNSPA